MHLQFPGARLCRLSRARGWGDVMANIRFVNSNPLIGADEDDTHFCSNGDRRGHSAKCPWLTLQFSVDQLAKINGGELHVAQGEYDENVVMLGKKYSGISIVGDLGGAITSPIDAQYCEIRPLVKARDATKPVFLIKDPDKIRLENLNIVHGRHGVAAADVHTMQLVDCCISDNDAGVETGAGFVLLRCHNVLVDGCRVFNNKALDPQSGMGGGGAIVACTNVTVEGSFFHNNEAGLAGGGLRIEKSGGDIRIDDTIFGDPHLQILPPGFPSPLANTANFGGAVSVDEIVSSVKFGKVKRNQYLGNRAADSGGALAVEVTTCEIGQDLFQRNQAQRNGGALYLHNSVHVHMAGSDLRENEALGSDGGAIYAAGEGLNGPLPGDVTLSRVELRANKASNGAGGGLCARFDIKLEVIHSKFIEKNEASIGGGLFYSGGDDNRRIDIRERSLFTDNVADIRGGGCHIIDAEAHIHDTQFVNNTADTGGGLSFIGTPRGSLALARCRFNLNKAGDGGGAFIEDTLAGTVENNEVIGNQGGFHFLNDLMRSLGVKHNVLNGNISRAGPLEDLISDKDTSAPPLTVANLAGSNTVPVAGIIVK